MLWRMVKARQIGLSISLSLVFVEPTKHVSGLVVVRALLSVRANILALQFARLHLLCEFIDLLDELSVMA